MIDLKMKTRFAAPYGKEGIMRWKKMLVYSVWIGVLFGFFAFSACSDGRYGVSVAYKSEVGTLRVQPEEAFTLDDIHDACPDWFDLDTGFIKVLYTDEACTQEFDGTVQDGMKLYLRDAYPAYLLRTVTVHLIVQGFTEDTQTIDLNPDDELTVQTITQKIPKWFYYDDGMKIVGLFTDETCTQEFTGHAPDGTTVYLCKELAMS